MRFNPNSREGFSLVELMVVIAILAILAVVTAPGLDKFIPKYRVEGAAKVLATEMQLVRMRAISKNLRHRVTFNEAAQTMTVAIQTTDANGTVPDATAFELPYQTIQLGLNGRDHTHVTLGRNATVNNNGATDPDVLTKNDLAGDTPYTFPVDADGNSSLTFLPNGRTDNSGFFFLTPTRYFGETDDSVDWSIRAVEVIRAGMIQKYRYDNIDDLWKEY